jgi:hypothetical protein
MEGYRKSLRQAGLALILVGLYDVARLVYLVVTQQALFYTSFGMLLLIPGIPLFRGSLRAAWWTAFLAAIVLGAMLGYAAFLPVFFSPVILVPAFRSYPLVMGKGTALVLLQFAVTVWVFLKVTSLPVQAAAAREKEVRVRPVYGLLFGLALVAAGAIWFNAFLQTDSAQRAKVEATRKLGPKYRYLVYQLMWEHQGETGARVIAYNAREAKQMEVRWEE